MANIKQSEKGKPSLSGSKDEVESAFVLRMRVCAAEVGSVSALAKKAGLSQGGIRRYFSGGEPTRPQLIAIAGAAGVSVEWLATGKESEPSHSTRDADYDFFDEYALIPRYDIEVSAGAGTVVDAEHELHRMAFRREWLRREGLQEAHLALVSAKGNSMEPTVSEGDILLVDVSQETVRDDSIYVLRVEDDLVAKRLQRDWEGGFWVRSDNDHYKDQHVSEESAKRLQVVGRVVWIGKRV